MYILCFVGLVWQWNYEAVLQKRDQIKLWKFLCKKLLHLHWRFILLLRSTTWVRSGVSITNKYIPLKVSLLFIDSEIIPKELLSETYFQFVFCWNDSLVGGSSELPMWLMDGFLVTFFWRWWEAVCIHISHIQLPYTVINMWRGHSHAANVHGN